ncbi:MAG: heavy metal translocating P-type ATPase, partial [Treponema sp.]|nr:heavy metal translocating P-type ATPase [Treponema sp.]
MERCCEDNIIYGQVKDDCCHGSCRGGHESEDPRHDHQEETAAGHAEDDACCAACAAVKGGPKPEAEGRHIRFGSYALPLRRIVVFGISLLLWAAGLILIRAVPGTVPLKYLPLLPLACAYALAGLPVIKTAAKNLFRGRALDENFLMSIATIGAFAIGEWEEAVGVMIFYMIGELIQEAAVSRSRSSIDALLALKPDTARVRRGQDWVETAAGGVEPGTLILVRPGERIPLDGEVIDGSGSVDASMLTGESLPVPVTIGGEVRSGTLSVDGVLTIRTTRTADDSSAARIIALVETAAGAKARPERFITAFAKWYTPIVVGAAALLAILPPLVIPGAVFSVWLYRALILLVISCPCALVVSVPLGYFAGIGGMSRRGIMVKGAVHLDTLHKARNVAFDKTGTLTRGDFSVAALESAAGIDDRRLMESAVLAEKESNHPIAAAIMENGRDRGITAPETAGGLYWEIAGRGVELCRDGETILAGSRGLLESRGVPVPAGTAENRTAVYIARGGAYYGRILIGDTLKEGAPEAVKSLGKLGIANTVMFTGDARGAAMDTARQLGITTVEAELLPEDKLSSMEKLTRTGTTAFVGDGINDAPVLARSDVGIAMGSGA